MATLTYIAVVPTYMIITGFFETKLRLTRGITEGESGGEGEWEKVHIIPVIGSPGLYYVFT